MPERDPRTDPRPGDVLKRFLSGSSGSWIERRVRDLAYGGVHYCEDFDTWCSLADWCEWSANATIVRRAEDGK